MASGELDEAEAIGWQRRGPTTAACGTAGLAVAAPLVACARAMRWWALAFPGAAQDPGQLTEQSFTETRKLQTALQLLD